jgi:hypothetical protein
VADAGAAAGEARESLSAIGFGGNGQRSNGWLAVAVAGNG